MPVSATDRRISGPSRTAARDDLPAVGRELDAVVDQLEQNPAQLLRIGLQRRQASGGHLERQSHARLLGLVLRPLETPAHQRRQVDRLAA